MEILANVRSWPAADMIGGWGKDWISRVCAGLYYVE